MAISYTSRSVPFRNSVKYSAYGVHLRARTLGADLDSSGSTRVYRGAHSSLPAAANKCMVFEQAGTTNNPIAVEIINAGTNNGMFIDQNGEGISLNIDSEATTADIVNIAATTLTTGKAIDIPDLDALTTGIGVNIASAATAITGAGRMLYVNHTGATSTTGIVAEIITAATDETVPLKVSTAGTGAAIQLEGGNVVPDTETVTTGSPTLQTWGTTLIDSSGGAITGTLGSPGDTTAGQLKCISMSEASTSSTISITNHETSDPEVATFNALDEYWLGVWTGTEWATVSNTCTFV